MALRDSLPNALNSVAHVDRATHDALHYDVYWAASDDVYWTGQSNISEFVTDAAVEEALA